MKPRNFPDFIRAYLHYAQDNFTPKAFNLWTGLSVVAGATERKVWLPWNHTYAYYPNIFVMLISLPGSGKSVALGKGVGLLEDLRRMANNTGEELNIIPSQVTEAKFIELMGLKRDFHHSTKVYQQCSGYYYASEASNALKNLYGDFIACLTEFYDCPNNWAKATMAGGRIELQNVCLNLLAGSTFDYLGKLITDDNVMGGFASRVIYVVHRDKTVFDQDFQNGGLDDATAKEKSLYRSALLADLKQIQGLVGPMRATPEVQAAWKAWRKEFEMKRQDHASEKMQSLLVRTNTNVLKLSMLFSLSRTDEKVISIDDWDAALTVLQPILKEIPSIFREGKARDTKSQGGVNQAIFKMLIARKECETEKLISSLTIEGFGSNQVRQTVEAMTRGGSLIPVSGGRVRLGINPDEHF